MGNSVVLWRCTSEVNIGAGGTFPRHTHRRKATYLLASFPKYLPTTSCRHIWKQPFTIKDGRRVDIIREGKRVWREINLA